MTRLSRLVLGLALVTGAACSGGTSTAPVPSTMSGDDRRPLMIEGDTTSNCKGGWETPNGKSC
jgi:hypothetical protein